MEKRDAFLRSSDWLALQTAAQNANVKLRMTAGGCILITHKRGVDDKVIHLYEPAWNASFEQAWWVEQIERSIEACARHKLKMLSPPFIFPPRSGGKTRARENNTGSGMTHE